MAAPLESGGENENQAGRRHRHEEKTVIALAQNAGLLARFKHAFPFYVYAGFCVVLLAVKLFVPKTKGKSLEQIEVMWECGAGETLLIEKISHSEATI